MKMVAATHNPFEDIFKRLDNIQTLLEDVKKQNTQKDDFAEFPDFLSRKQAAKMVGVALTSIDRYSKEGLLKKHKNGQLIRFKKSEVLKAFTTFQKWQRIDNPKK
jgi:hypothetical protein